MAWQWSINKRFSSEDRIASSLLKQFMYASSTNALQTAVAAKYEKTEDRARGDVTYTYLVLCEMFEMSQEVKCQPPRFF